MTPERLRQIEELYHSARERNPNERAAFLAQACRGDDALRQELDQLLAPDSSSSGNILDSPAVDLLASSAVAQLTTGSQIGPYKIEVELGAGGMGEVYRAIDTRLKRTVAIKVAKEKFGERFEREARAIAALNHHNICTLYDVGPNYLVMELIEGPTLAERIQQGPLPLKEALDIARQIAEALEAAHEKGIVHRDLKPGNIKIKPDGIVKVLDFGLAKVAPVFAGDSSAEATADHTTRAGMIMGTAAYMSPEQAQGKPVDKRADIWAFGVLLYEMLTGRRMFQGETVPDTLAAVLEREPKWQALPATTPVPIRNLLRRCLQKDKNMRLRDAGDARIEIQEALMASPTDTKVPAAPQAPGGWRRVAVLGLAGIALLAAAVVATWKLKPLPPQPVTRTIINLAPGQQLAGLDIGVAVALSSDGTHLAYVAKDGTQQLYLRALDSGEAKLIPGTEGAANPFFSPDGQWVGFFAGGKLRKVSLSGGAPVTLADVASGAYPVQGASWGSQGMIPFATPQSGILQRVPDAGGTPQALSRLEKGETDHGWPEFLPGGKALLFAGGTNLFSNVEVAVQSVATGERRNLIPGATHPRYAASGHLVYAQGGSLLAVPFDPQRLVVTGAPVPMVEGVMQSTYTGAAQYSISATGSLVYVSGVPQATREHRLVWVSRNGTEQPLAAPLHAYRDPRLSPDGRRLAVTIDDGPETQIWAYDLVRGTLTRLTLEGTDNIFKAWTPDGKRIAFISNKEGIPFEEGKRYGRIFWQLADGSGGFERLTTNEYPQAPASWSPDGQLLAFFQHSPTTQFDIWVLHMGDRKAEPFLQTRFNEAAPRFSRDGRWLAYISDDTGRYEVYVQPYPGPGGKWQISTEGGTEPAWNPNGRELFYRSGTKMMAVEIATQPSFAAGTPRMLFEGRYESLPAAPVADYDVSPDGQRFLMLKPVEQADAASTQINLVLNWFEELKRRVPPRK